MKEKLAHYNLKLREAPEDKDDLLNLREDEFAVDMEEVDEDDII